MQIFLQFLIHSTLLLLVGGCVVGLLLRAAACQSPALTRFTWAFVLLLGVLCVRLPLEIPVLTPQRNPEPMQSVSVMEQRAHSSIEPTPLMRPYDIRTHEGTVDVAFSQRAVSEGGTPPELADEPIQSASSTPLHTRLLEVTFLFAAWLTGAMVFFVAQLFFWYRAVRQVKDAAPPDGIFRAEWERLLAFYGLSSRKIELRIAEAAGPGLLRLPTKSVIVVPAALWEDAPVHVRLGILKHELSHYRHHDLAKSLALRVVTLLHWFNPMSHYAVRKFDEAAEWRCDAEAFGASTCAESDFAETMLLFRDTTPVVAVCRSAFCGNNIKRRAERLADFTLHRGDSLMKKTLIVLCCVTLLFLGLFEIRLTAREQNETAPDPGTTASTPTSPTLLEEEVDADSWKIIPPEMKVIVKNEAGEPVKDVELFLNIWGGNVEKTYRETLYTDENGVSVFDLADIVGKDYECFRMWIKPKNRYVSQFYNQDRLAGRRSVVPPEYHTVLKPGVTLGLTVVDEDGNPIQNAGIDRYFRVQYGFGGEKTGADGKWMVDKANPDVGEYRFQIWHPDYVDLDVTINQGTPEMERLKNQTERFVLKRGVNVFGTIINTDGKPIADAKVELGHHLRMFYQQGKEYYQETQTDSDGNYSFPATPTGTKILIVTAPGKAPQIRQLAIEQNLERQDFRLQTGHTIRFKVVDADGQPVVGAYIGPYSWQGSEDYLMYDKFLRTDEQGEVGWNDALADAVGYSIGFRGMLSEQRIHSFVPREEPYIVTLHAQPVFIGKVVDKETGQPIQEFTVIPGAVWTADSRDRVIWQQGQAIAAAGGEYRLPIDFQYHAVAVRIDATEYLSAESEPFVGVRGEKVVDFELTSAAPITGVILLPDGQPAQNAEVRLLDSRVREDIFRGELAPRLHGGNDDYSRTAADGKFSFRDRKEGYVIVVAHENGCAIADKEEVATGTITLRPWARVEAALMQGDKPHAGQAVSLFGGAFSCSSWDPEKPLPLFQTPGTSDENGRVVFEKAYPEIEYVLQMRQRDFGRSSVDMFSDTMMIGEARFVPQPGETSRVQVGGVGSPVIGKIALSDEFQNKIQWNFAKITLNTVDPTVPKPDYGRLPIPAEINRNDRTARIQWYWKWIRETEEGKTFYRTVTAYNMQYNEEDDTCPIVLSTSIDAPINSDGTFRVEDVVPGKYKVTFYSFQPKPGSEIQPGDHLGGGIATRDTFENSWSEPEIIVPPIPGKQSNTPFNAGAIRIAL